MAEGMGVKAEENNKRSDDKFATAPMGRLILSMSMPAMVSMLVQALYNVVDSIFVAMESQKALSAVSIAFPIQMLMVSVSVGTGVGVASLISRLLGAKDQKRADMAANHGIALSVIGWIIFLFIGLFGSRVFAEIFTTDKEVVSMCTWYLIICCTMSIGAFLSIVGGRLLQATGDMIHPMTTQLVGAVVNIVLDPILIFGMFGMPHFGIAGAALATVLGQIVSGIYIMYVLYKKEHTVTINMKGFRFNSTILKEIFIVGVPSMIMQAIGSFLVTGLNFILAKFSLVAVSVLGIYYKLQSFIFMPVFGLSQGTLPVIGYNYGAKIKKRMFEALKVSCMISFCIMLFGTFLFQVFPEFFLKLFNADAEMMQIGVQALKTISLSFVLAAFGIMFGTFFQSIGDGFKSMIISFLRQLIVLLPCAYVLANKYGVNAFWYAFVIAEGVSFIVCIVWLISTMKNMDKRMGLMGEE